MIDLLSFLLKKPSCFSLTNKTPSFSNLWEGWPRAKAATSDLLNLILPKARTVCKRKKRTKTLTKHFQKLQTTLMVHTICGKQYTYVFYVIEQSKYIITYLWNFESVYYSVSQEKYRDVSETIFRIHLVNGMIVVRLPAFMYVGFAFFGEMRFTKVSWRLGFFLTNVVRTGCPSPFLMWKLNGFMVT